MSVTLVVMAAGLGKRYGGPKQLEPVGPAGETLIDYALFDGRRAGFDRAVLVVASGRVRIRVLDAVGLWLGLTHARDLPLVREQLRKAAERGEYPAPLWK